MPLELSLNATGSHLIVRRNELKQNISIENELKETRNLSKHVKAGDFVNPQKLLDIKGDPVQIPDPKLSTHLQFRRYSGCPVCNLHLRSFARRIDEIKSAGIREVVVFHSSAKVMQEFQGELPFQAIADPRKKLYAEFGADRSMPSTAPLNPRTWCTACNALLRGYRFNRLRGAKGEGEAQNGLPSEFLISSDGTILEAKYGKRIDDHWSVDEVLRIRASK
jgi:peroxiredoxin